MALLRVALRLDGPLVTPLASGTLFGMVCVAFREGYGEAALEGWLADPERLWGLSDAFPAGLLPRPLLAPSLPPPGRDTAEAKKLKRRQFVTRDGFLAKRHALSASAIEPYLRSAETKIVRMAHNTINRLTSSTPDQGGLFFVDEDWSGVLPRRDNDGRVSTGPDRDLYVEADGAERERVRALLDEVGERGFGRKAGLGRGRFEVVSVSRDLEFEGGPTLRRMSLSRGAITPGMGDVRARLVPHFGKIGPELSVGAGATPFKRPLLLTEAGATFVEVVPGRQGAWLKNVHPTRSEIGHNAFHVSIGFNEAAQ
jgi:CRISPR-associated protein Csm4